eukprot:PLAT2529.2.p1 GENE.PLAT2529.2~~PLAT2529.2.p1  ORF type:complete len:717 (+),score=294.88 PLAT2529.2:1523-3673(+)
MSKSVGDTSSTPLLSVTSPAIDVGGGHTDAAHGAGSGVAAPARASAAAPAVAARASSSPAAKPARSVLSRSAAGREAAAASMPSPLLRRDASYRKLLEEEPGLSMYDIKATWEFPGWGEHVMLELTPPTPLLDDHGRVREAAKDHRLNQFFSTAICGNDITSSALYVCGLTALQAGVYAPLCLLLASFTLHVFRRIYGEAVTALPLNGGAYNVLLNSTTKMTAAMAACLTILSYVATGVVSSVEAISYLQVLAPSIGLVEGALMLLGFFALLNLMGISESAKVAAIIFTIHIITLSALVIACLITVGGSGFHLFMDNVHAPQNPPFWRAMLYGFSSAMLGVSGFETSANFVEEQKPGVFVKTLRNMWVAVAFFNPLLSFLSLCVAPLPRVQLFSSNLLAYIAELTGGQLFARLVSLDAFMVLAGSVLTSFVGVTGLVRRMSLDRCLPEMLLAENSCRKTAHWIIISFFLICASMCIALKGSVDQLSSIYSLAFMSVMMLFAIGDGLLKYKRPSLHRDVRASWAEIIIGCSLVFASFMGMASQKPADMLWFLLYFAITTVAVGVMFLRLRLLKFLAHAGGRFLHSLGAARAEAAIISAARSIAAHKVVFFCRDARLPVLNKVVMYVRANEDATVLHIVHCYEDDSTIPPKLAEYVAVLDSMYPKIKIDLIMLRGAFGRPAIDFLEKALDVPKNMMFITCPTTVRQFAHLGGVRLVTH